jgi:antitoxin (DNA-binding transcriptional repressor) of toxin-antitoxin stability system
MEINASEFKAKCLALIDQVHQGGESIFIRKRGRIVARLTGESEPENRPWLMLRGKSQFAGDPYGPVVNEKDIEALQE